MQKHPYWKTIYFDGFAGSGERKSKRKSPLYQQLLVTQEDEKLYKGAAEKEETTMPGDLSFDYYYFVDTNEKSLEKLKNKLEAFEYKRKFIKISSGRL